MTLSPLVLSISLFTVVVLGLALTKPASPAVFPSPPKVTDIPLPTPTPLPYPLPKPANALPPPWLTARAINVLDLTSDQILYQKNADAQLLPASTTKMMTALVVIDQFPIDEVVTITNANEAVGHRAELLPGEQFTVKDLLYALLLDSGNDAAVTLAQHDPEGYSHFINLMNQKAQDLGLTNTHFTNASGIESPQHYSSASDLSVTAQNLLKNDLLREIVATPQKTITSISNGTKLNLANTNLLIGTIPGVSGIKTGWTELAGDCLVTLVTRDGHPVIIVILGSSDRFGETKQLIDWLFNHFQWSWDNESLGLGQ